MIHNKKIIHVYYCLNFSQNVDSDLQRSVMQYVCYAFLVFLVRNVERIHKINDGSPVISRNTWSMYAR
ncbi:MAG: hypothetical protein EBQ97_07850 [Bacteroidetes bacterium]|nr:hypothetical protein [Bacteroidota bacterium]